MGGISGGGQEEELAALLDAVRHCRACAPSLPLGSRPVLRAATSARLLIIGQAPGTRVHQTGIPWNDPSGERLRFWLGISPDTFYDEARVAIVPMGFCYPGKGRGGDLPPRPECAALWHERLQSLLTDIRLTLLVGRYAQRHYLGAAAGMNLTETVRQAARYGPRFFPLPHPSPRNLGWLSRNPWFERELLQQLRTRVGQVLG